MHRYGWASDSSRLLAAGGLLAAGVLAASQVVSCGSLEPGVSLEPGGSPEPSELLAPGGSPEPDGSLEPIGSHGPEGSLELWLRADPADLDGLQSLTLTTDWAGANAGPVRDESWRRIELEESQIELPMPDGGAVLAARGPIASGAYDRVFVSAPSVVGTGPDGKRAALISHIEPIARGLDLPAGEHVAVEIDLVVLPGSSESDGRREVFVKDARLLASPPVAPNGD